MAPVAAATFFLPTFLFFSFLFTDENSSLVGRRHSTEVHDNNDDDVDEDVSASHHRLSDCEFLAVKGEVTIPNADTPIRMVPIPNADTPRNGIKLQHCLAKDTDHTCLSHMRRTVKLVGVRSTPVAGL